MKFPELFHAQTEWIAANIDKRNIAYVLHLGDIVNNNNKPQWEVAQAAMKKLDGVVHYAMAPGNHDYGPNGDASTRDTLFNEYFSFDTCAKWPSFGGAFKDGQLDSTFHTLRIGDADWLVLALEWGPRAEVVEWAASVLDKHPKHKTILITHAYLFSDSTRYDHKKAKQAWNPHSYKTAELPGGVNDGEELWQKLLKDRPQSMLTINGHVLNDGLGYLVSEGAKGNAVHQSLVNYQMKERGGEAYIRLLEFLPDGKTVQAKSYSPDLDRYKTDPDNQFTFKLQPARERLGVG
jgi:hypothetical protein